MPLVLAWLLAGCGTLIRPVTATPTPDLGPVFGASPSDVPLPSEEPTGTATMEPPPLPTVRPTDTPMPTATPSTVWLPGSVHAYPGPLHYEGDVLTFEIPIRNPDELPDEAQPSLLLDGEPLDVEAFPASSPLRDTVLVFRWAWDTTDQEGLHQLTAEVPVNNAGDTELLEFFVEVLPENQRPDYEADTDWEEVRTACCRIDYISDTAAARDIEAIAQTAEESVGAVEERFGQDFDQVFPITMIDTVWGNGAYAADEIVMSYVDRAYVSIDVDSVLRHEATHYAARSIGTDVPIILVEGIAVYVSGGHYKPEPIPARAAAVVTLERYIPLTDLADHFRDRQHEVAYLEAAGLVAYLVETYGWDKFLDVYAIDDLDGSASEWLDQAFQRIYEVGLEDVEAGYLGWLAAQPAESQEDDLRLTILLFDTARRYQDLYAPYQESLPPLSESQERDATAEFVREPTAPENLALETMLISAREALQEGRIVAAEETLNAVNAVLDSGDFRSGPIGEYMAIATTLLDAGWEVQHVSFSGDEAEVEAISYANWPQPETLTLTRAAGEWALHAD